ncbi:MAG: hypothetical protein PHC75_05170 [Burkholderiales bacterium]|nr:hypothetical protein [Burkholderiales bacterium]
MTNKTKHKKNITISVIIGLFLVAISFFNNFLIYYINSLELHAYKELFKIDYSFFLINEPVDVTFLELLNSFVYALGNLKLNIWVLIIIMSATIIFPIYITYKIINSKQIKKNNIFINILLCLGVIVVYSIFLAVLMEALAVSDNLIIQLRHKYLNEHKQYCEVINGKSHDEFIVLENPSAPYRLILTEYSIQYYHPTDGYGIWYKFTKPDIKSMKQYCIDAQKSK